MASRVTSSPVLVTGAGGWLASHIIYQLLEQGYEVRGTVRSLASEKYKFLKTFHPLADSRLELVEADLVGTEGWEKAVAGCEYVLHVASPFTFKYKNQQRDLIEPAVKGVENVFNACLLEPSVKRVVQTSSVCSVMFGHPIARYQCGDKAAMEVARKAWNEECARTRTFGKNAEAGKAPEGDSGEIAEQTSTADPSTEVIEGDLDVDESKQAEDTKRTDVEEEGKRGETKRVDVNDLGSLSPPDRDVRTRKAVPDKYGDWKLMTEEDWSVAESIKGYELSKTLAEKRAWELVKEHNAKGEHPVVELVTMCPGFIFGPLFTEQQAAGESTSHILRLLNRTFPFVPEINSPHVDVRDAATCHILGMIGESAKVANKRFLVTCDDGNLNFSEQAELVARYFNKWGFNVPTCVAPRFLLSIGQYVSSSAAAAVDKMECTTYCCNKEAHENLGMKEWRTTESALFDHCISLVKLGIVKQKKVPKEIIDNFKAY
ncbi:putative NAD-dependent epimerase/dehydratase [Gregarina niphandrodes]|uniref:NAD-dependent epimerase/dehydratase n=1 Tax=Gregarina niphandrodes TaxID=110365 RepID=A0A023B121_GRENI|nr:putative NAD-dependent epimerase/dehydratase [Gregarina niphandrodes]EZG46381.1 putative NAD-dependent epimerase/dehydratase [Gregarina niphandrodes]|eukprot:XP_011132309.1 putative NAD-dependent epimerase/dehydratase [Gregarina niphandrodes]